MVAKELDTACRQFGFFRIKGHGVSEELQSQLDRLAREFYALPTHEKEKISRGSDYRGWFPFKNEVTSGKPDMKEGLYLGPLYETETPSKIPPPSKSLFPEKPDNFGNTIVTWQKQLSQIGKALLAGIAIGLGIEETWFAETICQQPSELLAIHCYPPSEPKAEGEHPGWGVGEHCDYGLVTILAQDDCGGLQVKLPGDNWIDVPAEKGVFIVNIGDMLDKLTEGRYRSTPHRVLNTSGR